MKSPFSRFFGGAEKAIEVQERSDSEADSTNTASEEVVKIPIDKIVPNRYQPRTVFDEEKIEELARTIHTHGVIQPIVIRPVWKMRSMKLLLVNVDTVQ